MSEIEEEEVMIPIAYEVNKGGNRFHVYELHLKGKVYVRRYNQFHQLHRELLLTHPKQMKELVVRLPKKSLLNKSAHFVEERRALLENYMRHVTSIAEIAEAEPMFAFLNVDNNPEKPNAEHSDKENYRDSGFLEELMKQGDASAHLENVGEINLSDTPNSDNRVEKRGKLVIGGLVIDNGSGTIKAGFAGEVGPRSIFPTLIGRPKRQGAMVGSAAREYYIGDEAQSKRALLSLTSPIDHGVVKNWDDLEHIWEHVLINELRVNPLQHHVMMTDPGGTAVKLNRERMAQIMLEKFGVPGFHVAPQPVLGMYAQGKTSGVMVHSGEGVTMVTPIWKGNAVQHAATAFNLTGFEMTDHVIKLLKERGHNLNTAAEREIARDLKEKLTYVVISGDVAGEVAQATTMAGVEMRGEYTLPDGSAIGLVTERFRCPEPLFNPSLLGIEGQGIHHVINAAIMKCDAEMHKELFANIMLSGGNTLFPGFPERLEKEMKGVALGNVQVKILAGQNRKYAPWIGGSILGSLETFQEMWVNKHEYEEIGPTVVHRKCL